jgi:DNA-binding NarL/FixJ family response regulator
VLKLVGNGLTTREIADKLCRSEKTIEAQRTFVSKALKLEGTNCLIRFAATYKAYL